ncbi:MAG: ATP-binding protein, partial [Planctomycetota bacterium]|nr:ATP-binding protein [Planctomycetota bacterium]
DVDGRRKGIRIVIEDEGRQVDPSKVKGRDLDDIRPGGLGDHIIRQVMDSVTYEQRTGKGMRLILEKMIPDQKTACCGAKGPC